MFFGESLSISFSISLSNSFDLVKRTGPSNLAAIVPATSASA